MAWSTHRAAQKAELDQLEQLQRLRALTTVESERLANLVYREQQRAYRLAAQIRSTRAKLLELEALTA
jgi:hypothetical protein